jgi:hypothetical protein
MLKRRHNYLYNCYPVLFIVISFQFHKNTVLKKIYTVASLLKLAGGAMYVLNALPLVLSHLQEFAHLNIKGTGIVLRDNVKN